MNKNQNHQDGASALSTRPYQIEFRDPAELRLHSLLQRLPAPVKESEQWHSFVDNLGAAGPEGIPPVFITRDGHIVDGGRRWRAARQLQWERLGCVVRPESEAAALIIESLLGQRDMTRGAKVYLYISLEREYVESAESRRLANLSRGGVEGKTGQKPLILSKSSNSTPGGVEVLCGRLGIKRDTYFQAKQVWELFHDVRCERLVKFYREEDLDVPTLPELREQQEELRREFEPQLLSGEKNLWNVISGVAGRLTTGGQARVDHQLEFLFTSGLDALKCRLARFPDVESVRPQIRAWVEGIQDAEELERMTRFGTLLYDAARSRAQQLKSEVRSPKSEVEQVCEQNGRCV